MLVSLEKQRGEPLKNDYLTFYIRHVTCKCEKKHFHCSFAKYSFLELPEKPLHASIKTFLRYMGDFAKLRRIFNSQF